MTLACVIVMNGKVQLLRLEIPAGPQGMEIGLPADGNGPSCAAEAHAEHSYDVVGRSSKISQTGLAAADTMG
jgi:hypothetical protein